MWHVYFIHVVNHTNKTRFGNNLCNLDIPLDERALGRGWNTNRNWNSTNTGVQGMPNGLACNPLGESSLRSLAARYIPCTDLRYRSLTTTKTRRRSTSRVGVRTRCISRLADRERCKIYEQHFLLPPLSLTSIGYIAFDTSKRSLYHDI